VELYSFDEEYLVRLRAGDPSIEQHFITYFSKMLVIKLRGRLRSSEAVDDLKQETFARVYRALRHEDGIRSGERLGSYVNSVCNFVLMEHYRSGKREDSLEDHAADPPDKAVDLEGALVTGEQKEQVREVLQRMPKKDRGILTALFLEERDKDEICRDFSVNRDYLRVLLYRAKAQFRSRFERKN
jgi:RNA polymerase sigma-70 factor (ECF subfamily)